MKHAEEWCLKPIEGDTGQSFMGVSGEERLFIKANVSPFFAALDQEGFTPPLRWSKRLTNGDMMVAQEWLSGDTLTTKDMRAHAVDILSVLKKLHQSDSLTLILYRLSGDEMEPLDFVQRYYEDLPEELATHPLLIPIIKELENTIPPFDHFNICACHGDVNHKNWMFGDATQTSLYLVDWDSAVLSDAFIDIGSILYRYLPCEEWQTCLDVYGVDDMHALDKVWWYGEIQQLHHIKHQYKRKRMNVVKKEMKYLEQRHQDKGGYYARKK